MNIEIYKGIGIDYDVYGKNEYTVQIDGDEFWFISLEEARKSIDDYMKEK